MTSQPHEIYSAIQTDAYTTYTVVTGWESRCTVRGTEKNFQSCWSRYIICYQHHREDPYYHSFHVQHVEFVIFIIVISCWAVGEHDIVCCCCSTRSCAWSLTRVVYRILCICLCLMSMQSDAAADRGAEWCSSWLRCRWWLMNVVCCARTIDRSAAGFRCLCSPDQKSAVFC